MNMQQNSSIASSAPEGSANIYRIIRLPEVKNLTGLSRTTLYERMKVGSFPHTVNLGGRIVGWLESDIRKWIESRISDTRQ